MSEKDEAEKLLEDFLNSLRRNKSIRKAITVLIVVAITSAILYFIYGLIPRQFTLRVSGGEILFYQHYLATLVRDEAKKRGVNLIIEPTKGSFDALKRVSEGQLDMAFIQGGLEKRFPNVCHTATLQPEALHFLVKPEIQSIADLKGRTINLGSIEGGTWVIAKKVLEFSGLLPDVDYAELNKTNERIVGMRRNKLPDAVAVISCTPSYVAEFLIKERGYKLLEIPFPDSLSLRYGWVAEVSIPDYTYNVVPPVPDRPIKTVGVNMQLVSHSNANPEAVSRVLEALYSPSITSKIRFKLEEDQITQGAIFPLAEGTSAYLSRNEPLLSMQTWDTISNGFGLFMSVLSGILVITRWLSGDDIEAPEGEEKSEDSSDNKRPTTTRRRGPGPRRRRLPGAVAVNEE